MPRKKITVPYWRVYSTAVFCMAGLAVYEVGRRLNHLGVIFSLRTFWWSAVICAAMVSVFGLIFVWTSWFGEFVSRFSKFHRKYGLKNSMVSWAAFLAFSWGFSAWVLLRGHIVLNGFYTRVFIYMLISTLGMLFLKPITAVGNWKISLTSSMLVTAAIFKAMIYAFQGVSASPFSLSWSEGSRYYYGSLNFSNKLYGLELPPSPWHASRYLLMALPFAVPGLSIWFHRLWQVCLWIGLAGWTGYLLARRLEIKNLILIIPFSAWVFLYLNLGPVYYHLYICVILIFWGVDFDKPQKTLVVLLISSVWAGLSRINWVPVPLFLVLTLYFLERSWHPSQQGWKYMGKTVIWGSGLVIAFLSYAAYINFSGNDISKFGSSFSSDLLWNRLWPNPTFQMGILLGALIVSLPLWLVLFVRLQKAVSFWNPIIWLAFTVMVTTLFLGGLVVSVKIGGGSNLHNMDSYFVLLITASSYVFWGRDVYSLESANKTTNNSVPLWVCIVVITVPVLLTLREGGVISMPDLNKDKADLQQLQQIVLDTAESGGEILFIAERQLQVFDLVPEVPFIPEYEKIELMEMAMSGNEMYLERFYNDISNQRFALIISDSIRKDLKDEADAFSEEHNVWVEKVVRPLVDSYQYYPLGGRRSIFIMTPGQQP
jgi:hypothetical protein